MTEPTPRSLNKSRDLATRKLAFSQNRQTARHRQATPSEAEEHSNAIGHKTEGCWSREPTSRAPSEIAHALRPNERTSLAFNHQEKGGISFSRQAKRLTKASQPRGYPPLLPFPSLFLSFLSLSLSLSTTVTSVNDYYNGAVIPVNDYYKPHS